MRRPLFLVALAGAGTLAAACSNAGTGAVTSVVPNAHHAVVQQAGHASAQHTAPLTAKQRQAQLRRVLRAATRATIATGSMQWTHTVVARGWPSAKGNDDSLRFLAGGTVDFVHDRTDVVVYPSAHQDQPIDQTLEGVIIDGKVYLNSVFGVLSARMPHNGSLRHDLHVASAAHGAIKSDGWKTVAGLRVHRYTFRLAPSWAPQTDSARWMSVDVDNDNHIVRLVAHYDVHAAGMPHRVTSLTERLTFTGFGTDVYTAKPTGTRSEV